MSKLMTEMLKGTLETMRLDIGRYPTQEEGLKLLVQQPADSKLLQRWKGPYLEDGLPDDPWGNPYQYSPQPTGTHAFVLYSFGADGKDGGTGYDADLGQLPKQ